MEGTQPPANEFENIQTTPNKKEEDNNAITGSEMEVSNIVRQKSRRTRSQVAPDWTLQESMILVNEVSAIEGDCQKSLSSYQKWMIIVENCNALDVPRNLNQCRLKWKSLVSEYRKIKKWESASKPRSRSYFSLDSDSNSDNDRERRREFGVPESFDEELFRVIDDHVRSHEGGSYTGPDSDPEAKRVDDVLDVIVESGPKKQRRKAMHQKQNVQKSAKTEKHIEKSPTEKSSTEAKVKPLKSRVHEEKIPEQCSREAKVKPPKQNSDEKITSANTIIEDKEQILASKLQEDVELINAILEGNVSEEEDYVLADLKNVEASETNFIRSQGDKLISCFGSLVDALDQLCDLVQERN